MRVSVRLRGAGSSHCAPGGGAPRRGGVFPLPAERGTRGALCSRLTHAAPTPHSSFRTLSKQKTENAKYNAKIVMLGQQLLRCQALRELSRIQRSFPPFSFCSS